MEMMVALIAGFCVGMVLSIVMCYITARDDADAAAGWIVMSPFIGCACALMGLIWRCLW